LRREAQQVLVAECARRLRVLAVDAMPARVRDDVVKPEQERGNNNKKKNKERPVEDAWRPSALMPNINPSDEPAAKKEGADWYPRAARVVGMCVNVEDREAELAAVDEAGELVDSFKCRWLLTNIRARRQSDGGGASALDVERKLGELDRLALFMQETGCEAVAVGTCDLVCRRFKHELETLAFGMGLMACYPEQGRDYAVQYYRTSSRMDTDEQPLPDLPAITRAEVQAHIPFGVFFTDETVPRLWAVTQAAATEHAEASEALRTALSSARLLQEPLVEMAHCVGPTGISLLRLPLHPLMSTLPEEQLERALEAEMVHGVCRLGVDFGRALAHDHYGKMLQFVPGLGPRKSAKLLRDVLAQSAAKSAPATRDELSAFLGPSVHFNCAGFIKFLPPEAVGGLQHAPGLEGCRVHPEAYRFARKMCFDAMQEDEDEEAQETEEALEEAVFAAMSDKGTCTMSQLDLEEYADHLQREEHTRALHDTLPDIRAELAHPFEDRRIGWGANGPVEDARLFELLTCETEESLRPGMLTTARQVRFEMGRDNNEGKIHVQIQCGLMGTIPESKISDKWSRAPQIEQPGMDVQGMHMMRMTPNTGTVDGQAFSVVLTSVMREALLNAPPWMNPEVFCAACNGQELARAEYKTIAQQEADEAKANAPAARQYVRRRIDHPLFKNGTLEQVSKVLALAPVGEVIFRPSSKGADHLTASVKMSLRGPLLHVDIFEAAKPSAAELGTALWIGRTQSAAGVRYDDLDEIYSRLLEPLIDNMREVVKFRHYMDDSLDAVERAIKEEKAAEPSRIPYKISLSPKYPEHLLLCYMPTKKLIKEYVKVGPDGYNFRRLEHTTVDRLLAWFKRHYRDPVPTAQPAPAAPSASGADPAWHAMPPAPPDRAAGEWGGPRAPGFGPAPPMGAPGWGGSGGLAPPLGGGGFGGGPSAGIRPQGWS